MKTLGIYIFSLGMMTAPAIALAENSSCKDTIIVFNDDNPLSSSAETARDNKQSPRVTMVLDCLASSTNIPESTTLHFFTYSQGKFCQSSRVCGNVRAWRGQFKVGTRVYFGQPLFPQQGTSAYSGNSGCDEETETDNDTSGREYPYPGYWWSNPMFCESGRSNVYAEFRLSRDILDRSCKPLEQWRCLDVPQPH